jgi:hypothetical protein
MPACFMWLAAESSSSESVAPDDDASSVSSDPAVPSVSCPVLEGRSGPVVDASPGEEVPEDELDVSALECPDVLEDWGLVVDVTVDDPVEDGEPPWSFAAGAKPIRLPSMSNTA